MDKIYASSDNITIQQWGKIVLANNLQHCKGIICSECPIGQDCEAIKNDLSVKEAIRIAFDEHFNK